MVWAFGNILGIIGKVHSKQSSFIEDYRSGLMQENDNTYTRAISDQESLLDFCMRSMDCTKVQISGQAVLT